MGQRKSFVWLNEFTVKTSVHLLNDQIEQKKTIEFERMHLKPRLNFKDKNNNSHNITL